MTLNDILSAPRKPVDGPPSLAPLASMTPLSSIAFPSLATSSAPSVSMTPAPAIASATSLRDLIPSTDSRLASAQQGLQQAQMHVNQGWGTANNHPGFLGKALHGLSVAGNIAGNIFAPETLALIPGTQLNNQMKVSQAQTELGQAQTQKTQEVAGAATASEKEAKANKENTQADDMTPFLMSKEQAHAINQDDLAGTRTTMRDYGGQLKAAGRNEVLSDNNQRTNDTRQSMSDDKLEEAAKTAAAKPGQRDDRYIAILAKPPGERTADELKYKQGYEGWVSTKMTQPGIARAVAGANARPLQIVNPVTGDVNYDHAGHAIAHGESGPQSNEYKAQGSLQKDMTSGRDAQANTSIVTALHHADLFDKAVDALHNGDAMQINRIGNELGMQMGSDAKTNISLIRDGLATEAARAYKGGPPDAGEINDFRKNLPVDGSPKIMHGGVQTIRGMLSGKSQGLAAQYAAGMSGRPNFVPPSAPSISVTAPDGSVHPFENQKQADAFKKLAGIK